MSGGEVKAQALYAVCCQWATERNEYKMPSRKFGLEMTERYNKKNNKSTAYIVLLLNK
ncbi:MAG: hypothetical protein NC177_12435 [Ruminococcus flavefaciens]|nr:hypothetical protein [Ruminococcus flavefaciens]